MPFNHYVKIRRILEDQPDGWVIMYINEPTRAKNFKGETVNFDHYYRVFDRDGTPIKYCKFQQIDMFARTMNCTVAELPVVESKKWV